MPITCKSAASRISWIHPADNNALDGTHPRSMQIPRRLTPLNMAWKYGKYSSFNGYGKTTDPLLVGMADL